MSASISQIEFWKEGIRSKGSQGEGGEGGEGAVFLSYDVFLGLSLLGGFFALDHLYLRSPLTFIAKFLVNIFFFGVWWFYDAVQAIFHRDVVKVYGLGVPGLGPKGIAAGVLASEVPDKKHFRFLMYALALFVGGGIGLDSFLIGDKQTGLIRLVCMLSVILAPVAIGWWAYNSFKFITDTKEVVQRHSEFFGAPKMTLQDELTAKFPFLSLFFNPMDTIQRFINGIFGPVIQPLQQTAQAAINTVDRVVKTVDDTVVFGKEVVSKSSDIVDEVSKTVDKVATAMQSTGSVVPGMALYSEITPNAVANKVSNQPGEMKGGAVAAAVVGGAAAITEGLKPIHMFVIGTIVLISVSGIYLTYHRSKNVQPRNDTPPEPGVFRESDRQGSTA